MLRTHLLMLASAVFFDMVPLLVPAGFHGRSAKTRFVIRNLGFRRREREVTYAFFAKEIGYQNT